MERRQTSRMAWQGLVLLALCAATCTASGLADDAFARGWSAYQAGQYNGAMQLWLPLADAGNADAQLNIGILYDVGQGVATDPVEAAHWYRRSAEHGHAAAQYNLGLMYVAGRGVPQDNTEARFWFAQAAGQGLQEASAMLSDFERRETPAASVLGSRESFIDSLSGTSTGTAWPVAGGYAITSNHVVADSEAVSLYDMTGQRLHATVAVRDTVSDLAVLRVDEADKLPPALPLAQLPGRLGSDVFTLGFPRVDILGRTPKLTEGIISSVNGYRDDPGSYQTSVQIQPGNSGGPLLNMDGEVVGIVSSMLGTVTEGAEPVVMPNISYAVKVELLQALLAPLPQRGSSAPAIAVHTAPLADLAERIQPSVLLVVAND
ncbi:MAG: tetratricopeptide repeat-containing serine protease family protein [Pseudomonadota bacterium]